MGNLDYAHYLVQDHFCNILLVRFKCMKKNNALALDGRETSSYDRITCKKRYHCNVLRIKIVIMGKLNISFLIQNNINPVL